MTIDQSTMIRAANLVRHLAAETDKQWAARIARDALEAKGDFDLIEAVIYILLKAAADE